MRKLLKFPARGVLLLSVGFFWLGACKSEEKFPSIGEKISGPADIVSSPSGKYFYVLNSDYERRYNQGSLLVVDPEAAAGSQKLRAITTPRMGRTLTVGQNQLLATYNSPTEANKGVVEFWSLADEAAPTLSQSLTIDCYPVQGAIAPTQAYVAVSCLNGDLYVGNLPTAGQSAALNRVRSYAFPHRALYFFEGAQKTWILGFPFDHSEPEFYDFVGVDAKSYVAESDQLTDAQNEVPDVFEETPQARRRLAESLPYRMFIYPLTDELAASGGTSFRYINLGTYGKPTEANRELPYVYFDLKESDGKSDVTPDGIPSNSRNYRTNFWDAKPGLDGSANVFYLSQRGRRYGSKSNNIVKMTISEAALTRFATEPVKFSEIFTADRVYGFSADRDNDARYPSDFELTTVAGEPLLLVNHFRDLITFPSAPFYSITRKFLRSPLSSEKGLSVDSTAYQTSYYQLAVSSQGKVLTASFYGTGLYLFDANPAQSFSAQVPVVID